MPKKVSDAELRAVVDSVSRFPEGASVDTIATAMGGKLSRRTLQRRLATLVAGGRLSAMGKGRASRYRVLGGPGKRIEAEVTDGLTFRDSLEARLPISPGGNEIRRVVGQPITSRRPVGYQRQFLDEYRPNKSFYLSPAVRNHLLGMARASGEPQPAGTYARKIWNRLLIDLSWNSSRLEGNTYSLLETERLLDLGQAVAGKDAKEAQMILNHKAAIELLVEQADEIGFNRYTIQNLHGLLADNLLADPQAVGRLRQRAVGIDGTVYHPLEVPHLVEECFDQILDTAAAIRDPFEQAFFVTVQLPYLQPFEDVNKRVSRLAANIPLIRHNLSPLSFVDVPARVYIDGLLGVYELNQVDLLRDVFVWAYERSCARYAAVRDSLGEPDPFRLRHRKLIVETISAIVTDAMDKRRATAHIRKIAHESLDEGQRMRFVEVVETELMSLHEGNIARYRIRPMGFRRWQEEWR